MESWVPSLNIILLSLLLLIGKLCISRWNRLATSQPQVFQGSIQASWEVVHVGHEAAERVMNHPARHE